MYVYYPEARELEAWVAANGINGFRDGLNERLTCCHIRKVAPFRRAVAGRGAWVTGIRHGQSASRSLAQRVEWVNPLVYEGYPSIGCAPCTRAVAPGEDERSGRWWWERAESRECGLHPRRRIAPAGAPEPLQTSVQLVP